MLIALRRDHRIWGEVVEPQKIMYFKELGMDIPDWAVHIALPPVGALLLWAFQRFVKDSSNNDPPDQMSVKKYKQFLQLLTDALDDRYMSKEEAAKRLSEIEKKLDHLSDVITTLVGAKITKAAQ
jgi:hypothetical protein